MSCKILLSVKLDKMDKEKTLTFKITGEFLTKFIRELYIDGEKLDITIEKLIECVPELSKDIALDIIMGKKKLTGINDVYVEPDNVSVIPLQGIRYNAIGNDITKLSCGWISPKGEVFGFTEYSNGLLFEHQELAETIVDVFDLKVKGEDEQYTLEKLGYIKFSPTQVLCNCSAKLITQEQMDQVLMLVEKNSRLNIYKSIKLGNGSIYSYDSLSKMDLLMFRIRICYE